MATGPFDPSRQRKRRRKTVTYAAGSDCFFFSASPGAGFCYTKSMTHTPFKLTSLLVILTTSGCVEDAPQKPAPRAPAPAPAIKQVKMGPNVILEVQGKKRRVIVRSRVCLRKGQLELFLCRKNTKEHEAILTAEVDGRDIHTALIAAGAEAGSPVKFVPRYTPATGQTIKVSVRYKKRGATVVESARKWVRNAKTRKELDTDWVFGGSHLIENPLDRDKPKIYLANDGDLICVSNFETAMLDLPIRSSKDAADLVFEAFEDRIPPVDTVVDIILEPVAKAKPKK
jgi:hypothetical protein